MSEGRFRPDRLTWLAALVLLLGIALPVAAQDAETTPSDAGEATADEAVAAELLADAEISADLRAQLEAPLRKRVRELADITNDEGVKNVRGSFLQRFVKVDDDTYTVVFHKRIGEETEMVTERWLYTLKREGGEKWGIGNEELQRTVKGILFRGRLGDETFHAFDAISISKEGLTISGGPGTMWIDYWRGQPARMRIKASGLSYDYMPPKELNYYDLATVYKTKREKGDVWFTPDLLSISCEGSLCEQFLAESFTGLRDTTLDAIDGKLAQDYHEALKEARDNRKENPFGGYRTYLDPDQRWYRLSLRRDGVRDHFFWLDYDNFEPEEVQVHVSRLGDAAVFRPLFTYYSEATRASGKSQYDLEKRPDADGLKYNIVGLRGTVEMAVEDSGTMACDVEYELEIQKPLDVVDFAIVQVRNTSDSQGDSKNPSMRVVNIVDGHGEELTYIRRGAASGLVVLPKTAQPGEKVTVRAKFINGNSLYKLNPSYSYVSRGGWLPFVRFGDMIDDFDLTIKVPKRYQILGIGHRVDEKTEGDLRIARYVAENPVTFPTVIFGDYESDEPKFKATKLDGTEIPVRVFVDKTSMMSYSQWKSREEAQGEVNSGISEIRFDALRPIAEQAANSLNLYAQLYGIDYPFGKLDLVNDPVGPGFYGQAPASIIYLGTGVFRATGEVAHFGGENISRFQESVVAHEVGHQWWGSLITMGNSRNYWFVESLAEYSSAIYIENLYASKEKDPKKAAEAGRKAYLKQTDEWRNNVLTWAPMAAVQDVDTMWDGGGGARTAAIYNQGPYAFHILRETFGDEKFFAFLKRLAQELAGEEIVTRDIQRIAEESFGGNMDWFFDQWIRGVGIPEYSFNYKTRRAEDGTYIVEGDVKQRVVVGLDKTPIPGKSYRGVITITVVGRDKQDYPVRFVIEGETTPFAFKVPVEPRDIILNKSGEMLAYDVLVNRSF